MEKKTVLAIALISVIWIGGTYLNLRLNPMPEQASAPAAIEQSESAGEVQSAALPTAPDSEIVQTQEPSGAAPAIYRAETDFYEIEFSSIGATVSSLKLKQFADNGEPLEMVLRGEAEQWGSFALYFNDNNLGAPFLSPFSYQEAEGGVHVFTAQAQIHSNGEIVPFNIVKAYRFLPQEYLFEINIALTQPDGRPLPLNFNGYAYTLESGPQTGPAFEKLDGRQNFRQNVYLYNNKRKKAALRQGLASVEDRVAWAGIDEKYFAFLGVPGSAGFKQIWTDKPVAGLAAGAQFAFARAAGNASSVSDSYFFYVGPKDEKSLARYNRAGDNGFKQSGLQLNRVMDGAGILWIFETVLKSLLVAVHYAVGNWGWSIIVMTIIVKFALYPLTKKSMASTARMSVLQPKLQELQAKYKDNPQALQQAQMQLYQSEGVNPVAGCLPMLLQMPILFALYGLFNKYFALRSAPFIGWITDLSAPESVYTLPFNLPFLGNNVRLLPIIYVGSQFLMNKITQAEATAQNQQMKLMMNLMPVMFFFILYDMPSGLVLYWICSNILSMFQQVWINQLKKKGKLHTQKPKKSIKSAYKAASRGKNR